MRFDIITMFPDFFTSPLQTGVMGNALMDGKISVQTHHLADYKEDPKKRLDDVPYGGGAGMVLRPEPLARAIEHVQNQHQAPVVHFTPRGTRLTQARLETLATKHTGFILICSRYEGIDQRVLDSHVTYEFQVGDVIVSGGEYPALYFLDSMTRLIPGVLGNEESHTEESFSKALGRKKEYPHYTRPEIWRGHSVPEVLLSGHHKNIATWRRQQIG